MIGTVHAENEQYDEALRAFEVAIMLDPRDQISWNNLGMVLMTAKRFGEALFAFQEALALDPSDQVVIDNIEELEALYSGSPVPVSYR